MFTFKPQNQMIQDATVIDISSFKIFLLVFCWRYTFLNTLKIVTVAKSPLRISSMWATASTCQLKLGHNCIDSCLFSIFMQAIGHYRILYIQRSPLLIETRILSLKGWGERESFQMCWLPSTELYNKWFQNVRVSNNRLNGSQW